jgi:hypothetical protein
LAAAVIAAWLALSHSALLPAMAAIALLMMTALLWAAAYLPLEAGMGFYWIGRG